MPTGTQVFTTSGTFKVDRTGNWQVFAVGGGGSGGLTPDNVGQWRNVAAGGGGGYTLTETLYLTRNHIANISIGSSDSNTIFDNLVAKAGGRGGSSSFAFSYGGSGGSGGGGSSSYGYGTPGGDNGGEDGGNGYIIRQGEIISLQYDGKGQGTTTRAFGESEGTLYSGGGGGATYAVGGAGGGGNGSADFSVRGTDGETNTGGGGGGSFVTASDYLANNVAAAGGSGIVLIRYVGKTV